MALGIAMERVQGIGVVSRVDGRDEIISARVHVPSLVDVGEGHEIAVAWAPVSGATRAVVEGASVEIGPALAEKQFPDTLKSACSHASSAELAVPSGWRLKQVTLVGLKLDVPREDGETDEVDIVSQDNMQGVRLVVSPPGQPPQFAVPAVGRRGMLPASLTGAGFTAPKTGGPGVLTLPDFPGPRVVLSLAEGSFPEEFAQRSMSLKSAPALAAIPPRNLQLTGPDESVVWEFPNEMPPQTPTQDADLRITLEKTLNDRLKSGEPLSASFLLKGDQPSLVDLFVGRFHGALLRTVDGIRSFEMAGDPVLLDLGEPLDTAPPASAVGDLTVEYMGIRILETVSDQLPAQSEEIGGYVVGEAPVLRRLPPKALAGLPIARIGLVGRSTEECELSVQMVELHGEAAGAAIGAPGVLKLTPSERMLTAWVDFAESPSPDVPVGLSVRANRGRFLWVSRTEPLIRVAVRDSDPGGRALSLGGRKVADVKKAEEHLPVFPLPAGVFASTFPQWESTLFLKVHVTDLTLRYPR